MDFGLHKDSSYKQFKINSTGYRTLLVLKALLENSCTINELIEFVQQQKAIDTSATKDNIRIDINTLKSAGCKISRPSKANNYKYELISHPFSLNFSETEFNYLMNLRENFATNCTVNEVFVLNSLYKKIIELTHNKSQIEFNDNAEPHKTVNKNIFNELSNPKLLNRKIQIKYSSPKHGLENLFVIPLKILIENEKVYLRCYIFKYGSVGILKIDRIIKINSIDMTKTYEIPNGYNVIYELFPPETEQFIPKDYEKIIQKTNESTIISADVNNEFMFIQRILLFGTNFKIISPDMFKEKLINKIQLIKKRYSE